MSVARHRASVPANGSARILGYDTRHGEDDARCSSRRHPCGSGRARPRPRGVPPCRGAGRPDPARGRPDAARAGRRGLRRRGRLPRSVRCRSSRCSATTTGSRTGPPTSSRALAEAGVVVLDRSHTILPINGVERRRRRREGIRRRLRATSGRTSASRIFREAYAETTKDVDGPRARARRDRAVRGADRAAALLAGRGDARRRAGAAVARARRRPSRRPDPRAPSGPRRARPRAPRVVRGRRSTACPVYNVAVHVMGREFWVFELDAERRDSQQPLAVDET